MSGVPGCFHSALADLEHEFRPLGIVLHDTPAHLRELEAALAAHGGHPLYERVAPVADEILALAGRWSALDGLPQRTAHGDLKFNNILFAAESGDGKSQAVSIIDLDTLAPMSLWIELGDAWRSWCNRAGEDSAEASLDLGIFRAAAGGYLSGLTFELEQEERASLAQGIERISLELAARFAADALAESYFGWDRARFASAGEHNLLRARGQLSLYHAAGSARGEQLRALGL